LVAGSVRVYMGSVLISNNNLEDSLNTNNFDGVGKEDERRLPGRLLLRLLPAPGDAS
jgi:hypothetical protein